jgi:hypothetical protein
MDSTLVPSPLSAPERSPSKNLLPFMRTVLLSLALPLIAASGTALSAHAQGATSEDLFREGVSLFARGEVSAACDRFERSYKLDAAPGTLYNLATCHEKQGKLWQARLDYLDLLERATAAGKLDKAKLTRERLAAVEAQLPKISLVFLPQSNVASIAIDDAPLSEGAWRDPVSVNQGAHVIEFRAPGKASVKKSLSTVEAATVRVDVPQLTPEAASAPAPSPLAPAQPASALRQAGSPGSSGSTARLVVGCVFGGLGLAGLGVGTYYAFHAASQRNDATTACGASDGTCLNAADTSAAQHLSSLSTTSEIASGVAFGFGVVAVATGLVLIATSGSNKDSAHATTSVLLTPTLGQGVRGMLLTGRF